MKALRKATLAVVGVVFAAANAAGEGHPFPVIEEVPERELIGVGQHGYPLIAEGDKARVADLAASGDTPENLRFYSIWGLAISGYSPESASGLGKALVDRELADAARDYAAMGLRNFTGQLPVESKQNLRATLRTAVEAEFAETPDGLLRTLIAWGDAPWVARRLGDALPGHPMEIEVLKGLPPERAIPRLLAIHGETEQGNARESYNRRAEIGRALLAFRDKRGIDILEALLDAQVVPLHRGEPNHQYRHNVFAAIARAVGQDFGYEHINYHPRIDEAIRRFRSWWLEERPEFEFSEVGAKSKTMDAGERGSR